MTARCRGRHLLRVVTALAAVLAGVGAASGRADVLFSEIMYHPVEVPEFTPDGLPVLDLSDDLHEFLELHNTADSAQSLTGWRISGGIQFEFPVGAVIAPGGYVVIARDPSRLAAIREYNLQAAAILGPYAGTLGNSGDTLRLHDALGQVADSVSYSAAFPWPVGADALGADDEWTGLNSTAYQHRGRSLERVSYGHPSTDPANWVASPLPAGPTPGRPNTLELPRPRPVVIAFSATQASTGDPVIRSNQPVRIDVTFSATNTLSGMVVEYFVDNLNSTTEPHTSLPLLAEDDGVPGHYTAAIPGQVSRALIRYRFRADRGLGLETVSPRPEDPYAWHAFFVSPVRTSPNPVYEVFISGASLTRLANNISQSPRRIALPDPPGLPRASWNATEPAVLVFQGRVFDIRMRYHGSRYRRDPSRQSYKYQFPRYAPFNGRSSVFETDKGDEHRYGFLLYDAADLPIWRCRPVDIYMNTDAILTRLEQEELDADVYQRWIGEQKGRHPERVTETAGWTYKSEGVVPFETSAAIGGTTVYTNSGEGPYYIGNEAPIPPKQGWSLAARYDWTYPIQMDSWRGGQDVLGMVTGLWAARRDTPASPAPDLAAVREFLGSHFDVDATLTYIAIRNWCAPFDDATQNHFLWRKGDGRWGLLPWDLDAEFSNTGQSMFWDEQAAVQPDTLRGPEWVKDSFLKAYREEYRQRAFILNNTLLSPTNLAAIGAGPLVSFAKSRQGPVNKELGLGTWYAPGRPVAVSPANGASAFPPTALVTSPYTHTKPDAPPPHAATTWVLWRAEDGPTNALLRLTSSADLTQLPIPFDHLAFGETYSWKCLYLDADGHPSAESQPATFTFGPPRVASSLVSIDATTLWRYFMSSNGAPSGWQSPGFDATGWPQGAAPIGDKPTGKLPEPLRTSIARSNYLAFYFRREFVFDGDPAGVTLRLRQLIDDGVVVYVNGVEVSRTGMPAGTPAYNVPAARSVVDPVYEGPLALAGVPLLRGTNVLAAEVHQAVPGGNDIVFALSLEALVPTSAGSVRLAEVMAWNRQAVENDGSFPDYIELENLSGVPQSLDQFSISDNPLEPGRYAIPAGTVIPPNGRLVLWCDDAAGSPGLHTGFALNRDGQSVALFAVTPAGYELVDSVQYGPQIPDRSLGRIAAGDGTRSEWRLNLPTPGAPNAAALLADPHGLKVNEWMATFSTGPDWFELYNPDPLPVALGGLFLSDTPATPANTRIAALSFIDGAGYREFIADDATDKGARHVGFKLSGGGEAILLSDSGLHPIDLVQFGPQASDVSEGRLPDGAPRIARFPGTASPEGPNYQQLDPVVINEVMPQGDSADQRGVELFNPGPGAVGVAGWWLSDDPLLPRKYRLPDGLVIEPGAFVMLPESAFGGPSAAQPFRLDAARGGTLDLSEADPLTAELSGRRTRVVYGPCGPANSYGRLQTSIGWDFGLLDHPTPAAPNSEPAAGPVVFSEIQYNPPPLPGRNSVLNYLELQNVSGGPMALFDPAHPGNRWRITGGVSYTFPRGVVLEAGERLLVVSFDPDSDAADLASFLAVYTPAPGTRLVGPFAGALSHGGDEVTLLRPGAPLEGPGPDAGYVPWIPMDQVRFGSTAPWPAEAGGNGPSLQRVPGTPYGSDPANWLAADVSPGTGTTPNLRPRVAVVTPEDGASVRPGAPIALSAQSSDPDGRVRWVEFLADGNRVAWAAPPGFTAVWSNAPEGVHTLAARAIDDRLGASLSAPSRIQVLPPPLITSQPSTTYVRPGAVATLQVEAQGASPLSYQWYFGSTPLQGRTDAALQIANPTLADVGTYRVTVSDVLGSVTSNPVRLDLLIDPIIVQPPVGQEVIAGGSVTLSVAVTNTATLPLGYRWKRGSTFLAGGYRLLDSYTCVLTISNLSPSSLQYSVVVTNLARPAGVTSEVAVLTFVADTDKDGIPDSWENATGGDPASGADASLDPDLDGMSNYAEYIAGTDPRDRASRLALEMGLADGVPELRFNAVSNRTYTITYTEAIGGPAWARLVNLPARSTNHVETVRDPATPTRPRYYRITTPAQP